MASNLVCATVSTCDPEDPAGFWYEVLGVDGTAGAGHRAPPRPARPVDDSAGS